MGNAFGFLKPQTGGGYKFDIIEPCKAAGIDLQQSCNLIFNPDNELYSVGNITRGTLAPRPGIAGQGIWLGMTYLWVFMLIAVLFMLAEFENRVYGTSYLHHRQVSPSHTRSAQGREAKARSVRDKFRAALRYYVLAASDTQTVLAGAIVVSFTGAGKCKLSAYHFVLTADSLTISLAVTVFAVALVRSYWRNPCAALVRLLLSIAIFVWVALIIFREHNYAPDWPPPMTRTGSPMLLPVACLLEGSLRDEVIQLAGVQRPGLELNVRASRWTYHQIMYFTLAGAFLVAHGTMILRRMRGRRGEDEPDKIIRGGLRAWATVLYWVVLLLVPMVAFAYCWLNAMRGRDWMKHSGWMVSPNTEWDIWDSGQLIPLAGFIPAALAGLNEIWNRQWSGRDQGGAAQGDGLEERLIHPSTPGSQHSGGHGHGDYIPLRDVTSPRGYPPSYHSGYAGHH